jgi:L-lactate dehydrogenase
MKTKITVIGAGNVGSTIAFMMSVSHTADEVVLIDINESKALGEAMDIRQGAPLTAQPVSVYAGNYADAAGSDIVIITSGIPRKPGQTRMDLAQTNVNVIKEIAPEITKHAPDATYIIVSNPVDVLTYVFHKVTDIPGERIIGSGTLLDSSRLRTRIAEHLNVSEKNVHAYVFGEHGETAFIPWSIAQVSTIPLLDYKNLIQLHHGKMTDLDFDELEHYMRTSGAKVIQRKGATYYAIAMSVCNICDSLFGSVNAVSPVSTMLNGEYGISDVCLSLPTMIGDGEIRGRILPNLTESETEKLHISANALKKVIASLDI